MTDPTPTPWRASKCGYLMGSDGVGAYGPREVQVGTIGNFFDKELLPFNRGRWQADLELIVKAVNSYQAAQDLLVDIWFHFSATDDRTLKLIADRARALINDPVAVSQADEK